MLKATDESVRLAGKANSLTSTYTKFSSDQFHPDLSSTTRAEFARASTLDTSNR